MPLVPGQRGAFGDWLWSQRLRRYRTQADALADYRRLAGLVIAPSEYAQWESGSRVPKADNPKREALYAFYGSREDAPAAPDGVSGSPRDLVEALQLHTAAINDLVQELRRLALGQVDLARDVATVVGRLEELGGLEAGPSATLGQSPADDAPRADPASLDRK